MGLRWGIVCTDAEMEEAIDRIPNDLPDPVKMKRFARIYFTAWRRYGAVSTDHGAAAHVQLERSVTAQAQWEALGIWPRADSANGKGYPWHILDHILPVGSSRLKAYSHVF
jgi:hypothetical protein